MPNIMLINVTHPEESRVAIVKDGVLEAFEIESLSREHLKGNIYKGTVHRIHPALEAAFVNIGGDRDAFLPLDEICFKNLPRRPPPPGNGSGSKSGRRRRRIRDILRTGEELLVQITKEPHGTKPATLTTFYSLPGRYLVLLPGSDEAGISRRIEGEDRIRLRKLVSELQPPQGFGLIVRTAAGFDNQTNEFERDLSYLCRLWQNVEKAAEQKRAPALLYREHDIVLRTIRDYFAPDIDEIHIDNEEVYERAREFLRDLMPGHEGVVRFYEGEQPIFSAFEVEAQFESIFKRSVSLPSGGSIVIDPTEALTAIDVNSGGSVRGPNPEETAFRTNQEAATEACRQMRLRDIGGLIVIDFIDMREPAHIQEVERRVRDAMRMDKARHEIGRISRFGLMEISRQRMRPAAMATTYTTCAMCEGHGAVRTTESAALVALRKSHNRVAQGDVAELRVTLPSDVAVYLLNQKRDALAQLETRYDTRIQVRLSESLMPHQIELDVVGRAHARKKPAPVSPGTVAKADKPEPPVEAEAPAAEEAVPQPANAGATNGDEKKRRRRRGRRRGRGGLKAAIALGDVFVRLGAAAGWLNGALPDNGGGDARPAPEEAAGEQPEGEADGRPETPPSVRAAEAATQAADTATLAAEAAVLAAETAVVAKTVALENVPAQPEAESPQAGRTEAPVPGAEKEAPVRRPATRPRRRRVSRARTGAPRGGAADAASEEGPTETVQPAVSEVKPPAESGEAAEKTPTEEKKAAPRGRAAASRTAARSTRKTSTGQEKATKARKPAVKKAAKATATSSKSSSRRTTRAKTATKDDAEPGPDASTPRKKTRRRRAQPSPASAPKPQD